MPTGLTFNATVDLMAAILEARTDAKLLDVTTLAAQKAGFDSVLIGLQWKTSQDEMRFKVTSGYPEGWQQKYLERSYMATDPTVAHCQVVTAPWVWSEPFFQAHHSMALLEEAKSFGVGYGVSVPTHERLGVKSMVSFARHAPFFTGFARGTAAVVRCDGDFPMRACRVQKFEPRRDGGCAKSAALFARGALSEVDCNGQDLVGDRNDSRHIGNNGGVSHQKRDGQARCEQPNAGHCGGFQNGLAGLNGMASICAAPRWREMLTWPTSPMPLFGCG